MPNVLFGLVPMGATVFAIFKLGARAAEWEVIHSKDVKAFFKEQRRASKN